MNTNKACYLCGSEENITRDHVPPEGFFPKPKPTNLITVACCNSCNGSYKLLDERFRIFAASQINRSNAGEWIWKNKVMDSSFRRSPALKVSTISNLIPLEKDLKTGEITQWGLKFPVNEGENFLIRLTKGMLKNYFPHLDYFKSTFKVIHIIPSQEIVDNVLSKMAYDERGNGVFKVWSAMIDPHKSSAGLWVYVFYDTLMFMVEVDLD